MEQWIRKGPLRRKVKSFVARLERVEPLLRVLVPEVERAVGARCRERAVVLVEETTDTTR